MLLWVDCQQFRVFVDTYMFNAIKKDHKRLFWTAQADDENRAWHFERADGSFTRAGKSLFWYGVQDVGELERIVKGFEQKGRLESLSTCWA